MNRFIDPDHPMFRRAWVRWATSIVPLLWAGVEAYSGNSGWAMLFAAAGAYAFWCLIIKGPTA